MNKAHAALHRIAARMIRVGKETKGANGRYASYEDVAKALKPHLDSEGLSFSFSIADRCLIAEFCKDGDVHCLQCPLPWGLPADKPCSSGLKDSTGTAIQQDLGKAITYTKRYLLVMAFALVTTDDDPDDYNDQFAGDHGAFAPPPPQFNDDM